MIDLHSHTKASDGEKTPEELIDLAISKNITTLAITDHDTVDGIEIGENYAKDKNIKLIPGVELNAYVEKGQMHILGLFIDYKNTKFLGKLNYLKESRASRNDKFINELNKMGYQITMEELKAVSGGKTIGKPHFAKVFLSKNYIKTKNEIFDNFFNKPPLNKYKRDSYSPKDSIKMIKEAGGIAILAHPQTLKLSFDELREKIKELKSYGLDGLECYHSNQTPEEMLEFNKIANKLGLIITKGSDYHGPIVKPLIELGTGINNNIVLNNEDELLQNLLNYIS